MLADFFNYQLKRFPYQAKPKSVDPLRNEYDRTHPFFWATPPPSIQLFPSNLIITSDEGATPYAAHIIGVKLSTGSNRLFLQFFHGVRQKISLCTSSKRWPLDSWIYLTLQNCRIEWPGVSNGHYSQVADYNWWRIYNFALSGPYHKCRTFTVLRTLLLLNLLQHICSSVMQHINDSFGYCKQVNISSTILPHPFWWSDITFHIFSKIFTMQKCVICDIFLAN